MSFIEKSQERILTSSSRSLDTQVYCKYFLNKPRSGNSRLKHNNIHRCAKSKSSPSGSFEQCS